ncbi:MAG: MinD/ParA family protein, partial [Gammaproteobacteria bacterium]|nr:MinD/ParA family protein [Gammaproteobacteria bacterium]
NVDVMLGLQPRFNLAHVASGETDLDSTILTGPAGVRVIPASSGDVSMMDLPQVKQASIISAFSGLADQPDILLVDTAAGLSESVARFVQAAQEAIVVICDEPASITDSYALIKVLSRRYGVSHFEVITNQTRNRADGRALFDKIRRVSDRYLDTVLRHLGDIPDDTLLRRSIQQQQAVVDAYPRSESARAFRRIACRIADWPAMRNRVGGIEFFFERIMQGDGQSNRRIA